MLDMRATSNSEGRPIAGFAVDGVRKALDEWITLSRRGHSRSGITFSSQRGTHLCASGIKICPYPNLFANISEYRILSEPKAFDHYLFLLDGPFELVTDRNAVKSSDIKTLEDKGFLECVKQALDGIYLGREDLRDEIDHNAVVGSLINRLNRDIQQRELDNELKKIAKLKSNLSDRGRFTITSKGALQGLSFVFPGPGEENWVGALYTLFSHIAPKRGKYSDLWVRPVNMSGTSIDALALNTDGLGFDKKALVGLEYKLAFAPQDGFNHLLFGIQYIVCWDFSKTPQDGKRVEDEFDCVGYVQFNKKFSPQVAYEITRLEKRSGINRQPDATIRVISLKELIRATFQCEWSEPSTTEETVATGRRARRGARAES